MKKLLLFLPVWAILTFSCSKTEKPPNFLIIFTDDQRVNTLGCYTEDCPIQTPNIDNLAENGVRFSNAFVTTPICVCSRASLLSGRYTTNNRVHQFVTPMEDDVFEHIYPQYLKRAGYFTGQFGKYGVGITEEQEKLYDMYDGTAYQGPAFREYKGRTMHDAEWLTIKAGEFFDSLPPGQPFCLQLNFKEPHPSSKPAIEDDELLNNTTFSRAPLDTKEAAMKLPEFVQTSLGVYQEGSEFATEEGFNAHLRQYFEKIVSVDRSVGELIKMLDDMEFSQNTVIIFISDHGTHHGERHFLGKWRPYEESLRIPFIVYDPRRTAQKGKVEEDMVLNIDVAPTLLDLAGINIPHIMDGESMVPLINGENTEWRDHFFFEHYCSPYMVPSYIPRNVGVRFKDSKYFQWIEVETDPDWIIEEYYDLENDSIEAVNLIENPLYKEDIDKARQVFKEWRKDNPSTFKFDIFGPRAQFGARDIDWKEFKERRPEDYKKIQAEVQRLGVSWEDAVSNWEIRKEISGSIPYWY